MKPSKTQRKKTVGWSGDELFSSKVAELPSFQSPTSEKKPVEPVEVLFRFFFCCKRRPRLLRGSVPIAGFRYGEKNDETTQTKRKKNETNKRHVTWTHRVRPWRAERRRRCHQPHTEAVPFFFFSILLVFFLFFLVMKETLLDTCPFAARAAVKVNGCVCGVSSRT